jgi:hypothetical protein
MTVLHHSRPWYFDIFKLRLSQKCNSSYFIL